MTNEPRFLLLSTKRFQYLSSLKSVRETCQKIYKIAQSNLEINSIVAFDIDPTKLQSISDYIFGLIERDYGTFTTDKEHLKSSIPPHGRWRHFVTPQKGGGTAIKLQRS